MSARKDLTGQTFGRLTVLKMMWAGRTLNNAYTICRCECGNHRVVVAFSLTSHTQSCGCLQRERTVASRTIHGRHKTREYRAWVNMIQRCTNSNNKNYANYGGRGITVAPEWLDFKNFYADIGPCPPGLTLERLDVDGIYCKGNCTWLSHKLQSANTRVQRDRDLPLGVRLTKYGKYQTRIDRDLKQYHLGNFDTPEQAAYEYQRAVAHYAEHSTLDNFERQLCRMM